MIKFCNNFFFYIFMIRILFHSSEVINNFINKMIRIFQIILNKINKNSVYKLYNVHKWIVLDKNNYFLLII